MIRHEVMSNSSKFDTKCEPQDTLFHWILGPSEMSGVQYSQKQAIRAGRVGKYPINPAIDGS